MDLSSLVIGVTLITIGVIYVIRYGELFNPISGYLFAHGVPILAFLFLSGLDGSNEFQHYQNLSVEIVSWHYLLAAVFFIIPWILYRNKNQIINKNITRSLNKKHINLISLLLLFNVLLCFYILNRVPIYEMVLGRLNIEEHLDSLSILPIGVMATQTALTMLLSMLVVINRADKKFYLLKYNLIPLLVILLACTWQGNRQLILFFLFSYFVFNASLGKLREILRFKNLFIVLLFFIIFIKFQDIRLNGIGSSPFEFLAYLTMPELNYQSILLENIKINYEWPNYVLNELVPNRLRANDYNDLVRPYVYSPTSPNGYISYWYLDFGLFGVAAGSILLSCVSKHFFVRRYASPKSYSYYILIIYSCFTSGIYSHFLSMNNLFLPLAFTFIYFYFSKNDFKA